MGGEEHPDQAARALSAPAPGGLWLPFRSADYRGFDAQCHEKPAARLPLSVAGDQPQACA